MGNPVQNCIWCKRPVRTHDIEHVLPDALGCPPGFVLTDCVCKTCNNGLGHVDQALLRQFEILAFTLGVRRKGGRPPSINSWAPIKGKYTPNGPEMYLNAGPRPVQAYGSTLPAASARNGIYNVSMSKAAVGEQADIKFTQEFGRDAKFGRAVYKVAFSSMTFQAGAAEALRDAYDPVRLFVRKGVGVFDVLMKVGGPVRSHSFGQPMWFGGRSSPAIEITIFGVSFTADFDPDQRNLREIRDHLEKQGDANWTVLPRVR